MRNQQGHDSFFELSPLIEIEHEDFEKVREALKSLLVSKENLHGETQALINYLWVNEFWDEDHSYVIDLKHHDEKCEEAITIVSSYEGLSLYQKEIESALKRFFIRSIYFDNQLLDGQFYADLSVFQESYPEIYQICLDISENKEFIGIFGDKTKNKSFQLRFILKLIHIIPGELFRVPVRITIDFSIGKEYNFFISSMIENLPFANLIVDNRYSEKTDIYLSDILPSKINSKYIIWNNPPTAEDWKIFGDLVALVKDEKRA